MKYVSKIAVLLFATLAFAACSKKGSSAPAAGVGIGVGVQCVAGVAGCTPYYGPGGQWSGNLTIVNPTLYQQMAMQYGRGGIPMTGIAGISVSLSQGTGRFKVSSWINRWIPILQQSGQAFTQAVNSITIQQSYYGGVMPVVPVGGIVNPGINQGVTVNFQFVDGTQTIANAQLYFIGQLVAQGQIVGRPGYGIGGYQTGGIVYQNTTYAPPILPAQ